APSGCGARARAGGPPAIEQTHSGALAGLGCIEPLLPQAVTLRRCAIQSQLADAQMIVNKHLRAAFFLHLVVLRVGTPADERLFVTPSRKREQPTVTGQAAIANIVDKAVDLLEFGFEALGEGEIGVPLFALGVDLKDH